MVLYIAWFYSSKTRDIFRGIPVLGKDENDAVNRAKRYLGNTEWRFVMIEPHPRQTLGRALNDAMLLMEAAVGVIDSEG